MKKFILILLLMLLATLHLPLQAQRSDEKEKLKVASAQYEIIQVLMEKHDYSQILGEYRKIVNLGLDLENERPLVQATCWIMETLRQAGQTGVAAQIVNEALPKVKLGESKYYLMMAKGKILKDQGRLEEALETYRKALEFAPAEPVPEK